MKVLALLVLLAFTASADDLATAAKNAKEAREKRKKSTTKVITNADVKKSKAKLAETPAASAPTETKTEKSLADEYERSYHERQATDAKFAAAKQKVDELERELLAVEQSYYEEHDLDRRDTEIVKRFIDVQAKLEAARRALEELAPSAQRLNSSTAQ